MQPPTMMRFIVLVLSLLPHFLDATPRIVGGVDADPARFPYYVFLTVDVPGVGEFSCGGSLIHPDVVLTAAHCLMLGKDAINVTAAVNFTNVFDTRETTFVRVVSVLAHPGYKVFTFENDIALLQLEFSVSDVNPVKFNNNSMIPNDSDELAVVGFGYLEEFNEDIVAKKPKEPFVLQVVTLEAVPDDVCVAQYEQSFSGLIVIPEIQVCAAAPGKDSCQGDSGGPLVVAGNNSTADDVQVGIVSVGDGCANANFSGLYTRTSAFAEWIEAGICDFAAERNRPTDCPVSKAANSGSSVPAFVTSAIIGVIFLFAC